MSEQYTVAGLMDLVTQHVGVCLDVATTWTQRHRSWERVRDYATALASPTGEAPQPEPVAWQARTFYTDPADAGWSGWREVLPCDLAQWRKWVKENPAHHELRPLYTASPAPQSQRPYCCPYCDQREGLMHGQYCRGAGTVVKGVTLTPRKD